MSDQTNVPLVRLGQGDYTRDYPAGDPATDGRELLTATRLATLRRCPRQHYYRYELGLTRQREEQPLRMGAAFHKGVELYGLGHDADTAIEQATVGYETAPAWADPTAWQVEYETGRSLLAGHFWRYRNVLANTGRMLEQRAYPAGGLVGHVVALGLDEEGRRRLHVRGPGEGVVLPLRAADARALRKAQRLEPNLGDRVERIAQVRHARRPPGADLSGEAAVEIPMAIAPVAHADPLARGQHAADALRQRVGGSGSRLGRRPGNGRTAVIGLSKAENRGHADGRPKMKREVSDKRCGTLVFIPVAEGRPILRP